MSKPSLHAPPVRLIDDPSVSSELRDDVERAANAPSAYDTAAGLVAFQAAIGVPAAGGGGLENAAAAKGAGALATTTGVKLGVAAAGTIALILAAVTFSNRTPSAPPSRPSQHASETTTSLPSTSALSTLPSTSAPSTLAPVTPAPITAAPITAAPSVNEEPPTQATPQAPQIRLRRAEPESPVSAALRRETAQLGRIRSAMHAGRAREAYRLAQAGHAEFDQSQSMLWHEREALAILALFELGRDPEGSRRARELLERFPNSAFRSELEAKLEAKLESKLDSQ